MTPITDPNISILIIDNASIDGSVEDFEELFPEIEILKLKKNYGFSGGMNRGLDHIKKDAPDFVIFMNNDIVVSHSFYDELIKGIEEKGNNNIFSPVICYHSNKNKIWYIGGFIRLWYGRVCHLSIRKKLNKIKIDNFQLTDYITGCCMLISFRLVNELNGFDENFNMYSEDVDLCLRARKMGSKCYVVKKSKILHKVSSSIGGNYSYKKNIRKLLSTYRLISIHSNVISKLTGKIGLLFIMFFSVPKLIFHQIFNK